MICEMSSSAISYLWRMPARDGACLLRDARADAVSKCGALEPPSWPVYNNGCTCLVPLLVRLGSSTTTMCSVSYL